jgi:hypothetical protein
MFDRSRLVAEDASRRSSVVAPAEDRSARTYTIARPYGGHSSRCGCGPAPSRAARCRRLDGDSWSRTCAKSVPTVPLLPSRAAKTSKHEHGADAVHLFELLETIKPLPQVRRERHEPLFLPLPEHLQNQVFEIHISIAQVQRLGDTQTRVERQERREVDAPLAKRRRFVANERPHLRVIQHRQDAPLNAARMAPCCYPVFGVKLITD